MVALRGNVRRREHISGQSTGIRSKPAKNEHSASPVTTTASLGSLAPVDPREAGLDVKSLEDHRERNRWQSTVGVLPGVAECVLASRGTRVAFLDIMGSADVARGVPMSATTLHRCYSMTKPITAVALTLLVERGLLSFDDPVAKFMPKFGDMKVVKRGVDEFDKKLPEEERFEPLARPITMRHLLTHTSGLAYGPDRCCPKDKLKASDECEKRYLPLVQAVDDGKIRTMAQFCDMLATLPLRFQPGTKWMYSHSLDVAGRVVEIVSGLSLDEFLSREVFKPLGMIHTRFFVSKRETEDLSTLYLVKQKKRQEDDKKTPKKRGKGSQKKTASSSKLRQKIKKDFAKQKKDAKPKKCARLIVVDDGRKEESRWHKKYRVKIISGGGIMGSCQGGLVSCLHDIALFVGMLANGGQTAKGKCFLRPSTVRAISGDWLALRSVVGDHAEKSRSLPGWPNGATIGWNPLGHIRKKDKCIFMGGWSTTWCIYPKTGLAVVSMQSSLLYFDVPGWIDRKDDLQSALEFSLANQRRRLAALARHAQHYRRNKDAKRSKGRAAQAKRVQRLTKRSAAARLSRRSRDMSRKASPRRALSGKAAR
eukprot:TRINITY_DN41533_c0_g2_i1.p1 TRINITY_DN41533_c0_g2~~TRINITY_DN41533_c0_g2_i1.p1  ORF type:complete len:594 (+),score=135.86 TRINITY_DN41533_c0_g2_i1:82-1863(+)